MGNNQDEKFYALAWFESFQKKIAKLENIHVSHKDEAYTLCVVYLDQLSNLYKKITANGNKKQKFYDLLRENYSGNELFTKVYFPSIIIRFEIEVKKRSGEKLKFKSS